LKTFPEPVVEQRILPVREDRLEALSHYSSREEVHGRNACPTTRKEAFHEPRSAARPGCELQQRPAARPNARRDAWRTRRRGRLRYLANGFMVPMREIELVDALHEPCSGTGVSPVRFEFASHGRDAGATTVQGSNARPKLEVETFPEPPERAAPQANPWPLGATANSLRAPKKPTSNSMKKLVWPRTNATSSVRHQAKASGTGAKSSTVASTSKGIAGVPASTAHRWYLAGLTALRERLGTPCPKQPRIPN